MLVQFCIIVYLIFIFEFNSSDFVKPLPLSNFRPSKQYFESANFVMEIGKCTQRVLQRIQSVEPENATKIFGYLLLHHSLEELMEYAVENEETLHSLIAEAKSSYLLSPTRPSSSEHFNPFLHRFSSPSIFPPNQRQFVQNLNHISHNNDVWRTEEQLHPPSPMGFELPNNFYFPDGGLVLKNPSPLFCHYFNKGYCKHGQGCKFSHGQVDRDSINLISGNGLNDFTLDDNMFSPGSLEKIEMEIAELLKERRGIPVSIASLPMLYQEMYGKALQADGYLTESQRHGKTGFSLTKLLAQLRNIRLMERPHGQHYVVLVEDAPKYMEFRSEMSDHGTSSSHQIYLTFPAESTFTDTDVQNYFNQFGPVHDVRIPRQEKRMFGFVSFYHPQTVRQILSAAHPHIICGARVLVKPYKEKSKLTERKYFEKFDSQMYLSPLSFDTDNGLCGRQRACDAFHLHRNRQIEDCKLTFDLKRRELLEQYLRQSPVNTQSFLGCGLEESKILEDQFNSLIIASNKNADDDWTWQRSSNCDDLDRLQIQLPDSPFA